MIGDEMTDPQGRFLATVSHEVRTPLSGILGMIDLLLETKLDLEQKEYAQMARLCAENLLELMNATLEYSALDKGAVLDESEFGLRELLESIAAEFECKARSKGLRLIRCFAPDLPEMAIGDGVRLRQILSHLMANGIKFTELGHVALHAFVKPACDHSFLLRLGVADTGIGIPADALHAVFESFRQLDTGLARRYNGLGLGLSLAKKITSLMNGEISVSTKVGEGSRFNVDIPLRISREYRIWQVETASVGAAFSQGR
jgi:two-component system, sensor histidine kinase and response regulator